MARNVNMGVHPYNDMKITVSFRTIAQLVSTCFRDAAGNTLVCALNAVPAAAAPQASMPTESVPGA